MIQLLGQGGGAQPNTIQVDVSVKMPNGDVNLAVQIDPDIPFNGFIKGITEQIFAQKMQAQYDETIEYSLGETQNIQQSEARSLNQLGFFNKSQLQVRLKLKGG